MEINRKKLIYAILREINMNSDIKYCHEEFKVDEKTFREGIQIIIEEDFAKGFSIKYYDNKPYLYVLSPRITLKGLNYIDENNEWKRLYKGLKEIKEWIPFL